MARKLLASVLLYMALIALTWLDVFPLSQGELVTVWTLLSVAMFLPKQRNSLQ